MVNLWIIYGFGTNAPCAKVPHLVCWSSVIFIQTLPPGKRLHNYGLSIFKSPLSMGKLTISMAIFQSFFDITRGYIQGGALEMIAKLVNITSISLWLMALMNNTYWGL